MAGSQTECEWCGAAEAPANLSWQTIVAPADEPGERIRISGTVYQPDGATPAEGIVIYIYHTNAQGVYPKNTPNDGRMSWRHGYLRGWMRTVADGKYEFRTIKPSPYPGRRDPAHIHITISGAGYPEYFIEDFLFEGDPLIMDSERLRFERGGFPHIVRLERDAQGDLRGTRNIRLRRV